MKPTGQRVWVGQALTGLVCLSLVLLIGRLAYIQAVLRPALEEWSYRRQHSTVLLPARRGAILDRRYRVLAGSQDRPTIYADPRLVEDHIESSRRLAPILGMPEDEIEKLLDDPASPGYVILKRQATDAQADAVRLLKEEGFRGLDAGLEPARSYPMGTLAAQVLGFVGADGTGLEGIELTCDRFLRATAGRRVVFRDAERRAMFQQAGSYVPPQDGLHVVLTLDAAIQEVAERELRQAVEHFEAQCGIALVMDPKTGEMLAMANWPTFDPAAAAGAPAEVRRNRILTDPVEPGSVFKPYIMAPVLAAGVARPSEQIFCQNGLYKAGKRLLHDHHPYGGLTVAEVMIKSSNIGMAILGQRLGNERMYRALRAFGYGQPTGIDLPGESTGLLMPLKAWNSYSTTSVPMGQELAVTPIQIATAFSSLVNGGRLVQPRVVRAIVDDRGQVIDDRSEIEDRGQAIDPRAAEIMSDILVRVVNEGTGKPCRLDKWQVLGKTGTAQVPWAHRRGYEPDAYLGSFIAAAPAQDPSVVVLVMVRKPNRRIGYYGAQVAAPAVKGILADVLQYLNVPPDRPVDEPTRLVWDGPAD